MKIRYFVIGAVLAAILLVAGSSSVTAQGGGEYNVFVFPACAKVDGPMRLVLDPATCNTKAEKEKDKEVVIHLINADLFAPFWVDTQAKIESLQGQVADLQVQVIAAQTTADNALAAANAAQNTADSAVSAANVAQETANEALELSLSLMGQNCNEGFMTGIDINGNIICSSGEEPEPPSIETCDGIDNNNDGQIDEDLPYCFEGIPAPNTDGLTCVQGYFDNNGDPLDGCEHQELGNVSGIWNLSQSISYSCAFGLEVIDFNSVQIDDNNPNLNISAVGSDPPGTMTGTIDDLGNFQVSRVIAGSTSVVYDMTGIFAGANTFSGSFSIGFVGEPFLDCTNQTFNISGTR